MIKQFLKPNWKKIIVFVIILVLLIFSIRSTYDIPIPVLNILLRAPWIVLTFLISLLIFGSHGEPQVVFTALIIGIAGMFFWWIVTCFLFYFYDEFRDRKITEKKYKPNIKLLFGILIIISILVIGFWIWDNFNIDYFYSFNWRNCSEDSNCVVVDNGCCCINEDYIAINKDFVESWKEKKAKRCRDVHCPLMMCISNPPEAKCINNKCSIEEEIKEEAKEDKECLIKFPKTIKLRAIDFYVYTLADSDYILLDSPKELCISSYPAEINGYYLVQFQGPINDDYKNEVKSLGGVIDGYVPEYSFIVKMSKDTKERVQNLGIVQWVGIYQPAYKIISPELFRRTGSVILNVGIFEGEDGNKVISKINSLDGVSKLVSEDKIRTQIDSSKIYDIANIVNIQYLEEYIPPEIF